MKQPRIKKNERKARAIAAAVSAIYFADNSDFQSALWEVVKELDPKMADLLAKDETRAFRKSRLRAGLEVD